MSEQQNKQQKAQKQAIKKIKERKKNNKKKISSVKTRNQQKIKAGNPACRIDNLKSLVLPDTFFDAGVLPTDKCTYTKKMCSG